MSPKWRETEDGVIFQRETDNPSPDVVSVKLNRIERLWLEALKRYYLTKNDSTALKKGAFASFLMRKELDDILRKK